MELSAVAVQGNALQTCREFQLQLPEKGAEVASVDISANRLALLWSNGVLQCFSHQAALSGQVVSQHLPPCRNRVREHSRKATCEQHSMAYDHQGVVPQTLPIGSVQLTVSDITCALQISLRLQYHRKLAGLCEGVAEKIRLTTATPKKRAAIVPAQPSAQHAQHGRPSLRLCGSGLLAVAAHVHPEVLTAQAAPEEMLEQSNVMQASTPGATDHTTSNGPVATPNKALPGADHPHSCHRLAQSLIPAPQLHLQGPACPMQCSDARPTSFGQSFTSRCGVTETHLTPFQEFIRCCELHRRQESG